MEGKDGKWSLHHRQLSSNVNIKLIIRNGLTDLRMEDPDINSNNNNNNDNNQRTINVCFVGDGATGKTKMILQTIKKQLHDVSNQMYHSHETQVEVDGAMCKIHLADTQADKETAELRERACKAADVIFLCYSCIQPESMKNAKTKWMEELGKLSKPIILIGTKIDMRDDEELMTRLKAKNLIPITSEEGQKAAQEIGALGFFEISCESESDPLDRVFREGLLLVFGPPKTKTKEKKKVFGNANTNANANVDSRGKNCALM